MRSILKIVPTIGVLALVFGSAANAADVGRYSPSMPPLSQSAPLLVDEFSSRWYLRGDIGYRFNELDGVTNLDPPPGVRNHDLGKIWMFGGGVGYKAEWFRTDLTVDYGTRANFTADSGIRANNHTANIESFTGLVNIYADLGTWSGFTPYIGGGLGFSHLKTTSFNVVSSSAPGLEVESASRWNFAWAYMAGVSYRLTDNAHIDVGYRHVNMGDVTTGRDADDNHLRFRKMSADEIRVGFRYLLD